jgi:2,4-dienoyl-CoA reductase-like NADH-dependent reductase (Old Yellow Enzyme family)
MSRLLSPYTLRGTTFRNRAWVAPMCQYSSTDGRPSSWHLVHLGARATGGAGLVITEATAVTPEGRISPSDAGIWNDEQTAAYRPITAFIAGQGAVPGIQLGHAGRKASTERPWDGTGSVDPANGGWSTVAPSPLAYADWAVPKELSIAEIGEIVQAFRAAAVRADAAGFEVVELHAAHGYLLHQFLSPLSNQRVDAYGGDLAGRSRIVVEVVDTVREVWPERKPLFVRFSATDWAEGGWTLDETVELSARLAGHGVDLIDVSSGGLSPQQQIDLGPGYQVPFARAVRVGSGLPTAAVGLITEPVQAEQILREGSADAVLLARESLRDPNWPLRAQHELDGRDADSATGWPVQAERAAWR